MMRPMASCFQQRFTKWLRIHYNNESFQNDVFNLEFEIKITFDLKDYFWIWKTNLSFSPKIPLFKRVLTTFLHSEMPSVFATGGERDVQLYSVESELGQAFKAKRIMQFQGHNQRINSLAFNNGQDKLLASGSFSGSIRTWDIEVGKASRALPAAHTNAVTCLSFYNPPKYSAFWGHFFNIFVKTCYSDVPTHCIFYPAA